MRWLDEHRRLPLFTALAALVAVSPACFAQTPAKPPADGAPSQAPEIAPQVKASPEEVGDALMAHLRYQAAIEAYKSAPRDSADVWNKMGIAYQMMLDSGDAMRCYKESLKIKPGNAQVMNNLATVYDSQTEYRAAERMYRRALKLDPQSALILKNLGTNLLAQRKYKKGSEYYQAALAIDPQVFDHSSGSPRVENPASARERGAMNYFMAIGCARLGRNEQAIDYLRMALNEGFTNPKKILADSQFAGLRKLPAFQQLLAAQSTQ
jgi:tetratricopeptide (TPR) repeat protein